MGNLKQIEAHQEYCTQCESDNITLYTPEDEDENAFFVTKCIDCKGETIVSPGQNDIFILKEKEELDEMAAEAQALADYYDPGPDHKSFYNKDY